MLGIQKEFSGIPESGEVLVGKKKLPWYEVYKFTEAQEEEWRTWARDELQKVYDNKEAERWLMFIELVYGFVRDLKKKGELF